MSTITPRADRLLKAITSYKTNYERWDTLHVFNKVNIFAAGNGVLRGSFEVTEDITNVAKTLHGGYTSTVIDAFSIFGYAHHSKGRLTWTTDMNILYLNPGLMGDEIGVEVKPFKLSLTRAIMECILTNKTSGKTVARGTVGLSIPEEHILYLKTLPFDSSVKD